LADYLVNGFNLPINYFGLDISSNCSKHKIYSNLDEIQEDDFDIIVMAYIAEHLGYEAYLNDFQPKIHNKLDRNGFFLFAVPNPINLRNYFCRLEFS